VRHERRLRAVEQALAARALARWYSRKWLSVDEAIAIVAAAKTDEESEEAGRYIRPRMDNATRSLYRARLKAELERRGLPAREPTGDNVPPPTHLPAHHHCRLDDLSYTDVGTWYQDHEDVMPARAAVDLEQHIREHGCGFAEAFTTLLEDGTIILPEPEAARDQGGEAGA
jgi:hypothetical protein